ncbi:hypothetical protein L3X38_014893 [Prunus dulcis]|uniref:Uncharacterized protein n=1 Tax=Prunus dulcis TaxID=3755 RepID=A0AAD4WQP1_PRUDU|nr:hypothetical protein L3X38_014893 [Prunus dulcis]
MNPSCGRARTSLTSMESHPSVSEGTQSPLSSPRSLEVLDVKLREGEPVYWVVVSSVKTGKFSSNSREPISCGEIGFLPMFSEPSSDTQIGSEGEEEEEDKRNIRGGQKWSPRGYLRKMSRPIESAAHKD